MKTINKQLIVKLQNICLAVALLMLLVAAAFPLLGIWKEGLLLMRYVYAAGAALAFVVRATQIYEGSNFRVKRLFALQRMSALLYCVSAFLLFNFGDRWGGSDWIAFLLAGAIVQIYTSFMIEREEKKDADGKPQ
ncbi:MAG: hypothetical protein ACI4AH_06055 [Muribaculaceae bacterium]